MIDNNLHIVRQSFASTVFTHKVQEIAAERKDKYALAVKITNIVFVALVLILVVLQAYNSDQKIFSYLAVGVSVAEIIFLIVQLTFSFETLVVQHKNAALKYMSLRDEYRLLIVDIMSSDSVGEGLIARRDRLQREYQVISDMSPQTSSSDYTEAQKRLNARGAVEGEEFTWSDQEIDAFLPQGLRFGSTT